MKIGDRVRIVKSQYHNKPKGSQGVIIPWDQSHDYCHTSVTEMWVRVRFSEATYDNYVFPTQYLELCPPRNNREALVSLPSWELIT